MRRTPVEIIVHSRKPPFDLRASSIPKHWNGGDPVKTHFINAFSVILPVFERFFISTIQGNRERVKDPQLKKEIAGFCVQEGSHSVEHHKFNQLLIAQGYGGIRFFEKVYSRILKFIAKRASNRWLLALTAAGEHVTSFMGNDFLSHPEKWYAGAHPTMVALWAWHATEEIEHKAVCFDTYVEVVGPKGPRRLALFAVNVPTLFVISSIQAYLLAVDGLLWKPAIWKKYLVFMLGRGGFLRLLAREYVRYFQRDFHPWQVDDRHLI